MSNPIDTRFPLRHSMKEAFDDAMDYRLFEPRRGPEKAKSNGWAPTDWTFGQLVLYQRPKPIVAAPVVETPPLAEKKKRGWRS